MTRFVACNLDAEAELSGTALPAAARARLSAAATLLAAFCDDERDVLCTPGALDPARRAHLPWLPRPRLHAGAAGPWTAADPVLAWCPTASLRLPPAPSAEMPPRRGPLAWIDALWSLPRPTPALLARVAHRGFARELAQRLGVALPRARLLSSRAELAAWLDECVEPGAGGGPEPDSRAAGGGDPAGAPAWVLKPAYSAAGQGHVLGRGGRRALADDPALAAHVGRALQRHGTLLAEPWLPREADFGAVGFVARDGVRLLGAHRLLVDARGRFRGIEVGGDGAPPGLSAGHAGRLLEVARAAGEALADEGFTGPFGLDAFAYREPGGGLAFRPLVELNPRLTFGHVARALRERRAAVHGVPAGTTVLHVLSHEPGSPPPPGVVRERLLEPAHDDPTRAWLDTAG